MTLTISFAFFIENYLPTIHCMNWWTLACSKTYSCYGVPVKQNFKSIYTEFFFTFLRDVCTKMLLYSNLF